MYYLKFKRLLDIFLALILLFVFSPVFLIVSTLIKAEDPSGKVIFKQQRLGKDERLFILYKFRSMKKETYKDGRLLTDKERISNIGRFIRKASLDELPQLINVLKGEMSFIGPRPLCVDYLPYYTVEEKHRHDIRPGISGWAQVNGRNNLKWDDKFVLDIYYVNNISFVLDIKIMFLTIKKVLLGSDVIEDAGQENTQTLVEYRSKKHN